MSQPEGVKKTMSETKNISRTQAAIRFVVCSLIGVCVFFIKFPIGGKATLPIDAINNLITTLLAGHKYLEVSLLAGAIFAYFTIVKKKFWKKAKNNFVSFFFDLLGVIGFVLVVLAALGICPAFFDTSNTLTGAYSLMGKMFVQIMIIMFFIPFLTDYGLPEAIGVFVRPVCRAIWCVPGRVAVIIVSAFLGNFTVGHMQANMYYTQGKVSHKEALIMCTGFATPSIGLILSLTSAAGAMEYFTLITGLILLCVLVVTSITAHIPPLSKYPDEGYEGMTVDDEDYEKGNVFVAAWNTGIETCIKNSASTPIVTNAKTFVKSVSTVANISLIGIGSIVFFGLINVYTPLFRLLGYVYWPVLKLMGMQADIIAPMMGLGTVSTIASQTAIITAEGATMATKIFGVGYVMVILVFFGSFLSSLYSTKISMKLRDFFIVYFERAYLTILIYGGLCRLLFR